MKALVQRSGYVLDRANNIWLRPNFGGIAYCDGYEVETRIASAIRCATDISVLSVELRQQCSDWPSLYHLSGTRANILRPFEHELKGDILEIGAGCGAITRYLGECGANVLALEGSTRRAAIARSRTRDLANVTVLAEQFDQFQCEHRFDFIMMIGVLEYANQFESGVLPTLTMLERARALLKPKGSLILAIENQFGLKYFAGAPEDHFGRAMVGIEGRYNSRQPQTFGRRVLTRLLERAGFSDLEFLAPFPDYKLPISIVTEAGFSRDGFDAAAFAWQSVRRDPQLPESCNFSLELAWPEVFDSGLGLDLANSFLVVCSSSPQARRDCWPLAFHYSTDRIPSYSREALFVLRESSEIQVRYRRLAPVDADCETTSSALIRFVCPDSDDYQIGTPLSVQFIRIVTEDGWGFDQVARFIWRYLSIVEALIEDSGLKVEIDSSGSILPGEYLDAIPQNIVIRDTAEHSLIDREWQLRIPIDAGYLLFRSLLWLMCSISRFGRPASGIELTNHDFILRSFMAAGLELEQEEFSRYVRLEAEVQQQVTGRSLTEFLDRWKDQPVITERLGDAIAKRDASLARLQHELAEQTQKIIGLDKAAGESDERIAGLRGILAERDAQLELMIRLLLERETRIGELELGLTDHGRRVAGLQETLSERELRIADMGRTMGEREGRIHALESELLDRGNRFTDLCQELAERDERVSELSSAVARLKSEIGELLASNSWTLTAPLRAARRGLISRPRTALRKCVSSVSRRAWIGFPLSNERKQRLKDGMFRRLPFLVDWTAAYKSWENLHGAIGSWRALSEETPSSQEQDSGIRETEFVPILHAPRSADWPVRLIAFYLPQYHRIPENDAWWGEGFTEWTNVRPAQPQFAGHYQPRVPGELGYYSLLDPGIQRRQVELAQLYGIGGFCFYFYWFGGRTLLEQPIRNYLLDKSLALPFCLCWANENWTRTWDGLDGEVLVGQQHSDVDDLAFIRHVNQYLNDDRYIRVCGKPLLVVYRAGLLPDARQTALRWRRWCRENGTGEIYLACVQSFDSVDPRRLGFDAAIEFPPNNSGVPNITDQVERLGENFSCTVYDWRALVDRSRDYEAVAYKLFRGVCPSWDNTARRRNRSSILLHSTPCGYQEWLYNAVCDTVRRQATPDERLVFINAWNEWAEGAYLEPDQRYGYALLEATRMALARANVARELGPVDPRQTVAVLIHAFYRDVLEEILGYLGRLTSIRFRLYVSCTEEDAELVGSRLDSSGLAFQLLPGPNRGRDALPLLRMLPIMLDRGHDLIVKVHTKKSVHRQDGDAWRRELLDELLTNHSLQTAFDHFRNHPDTGILGPDGHVVPMSYYWGSNAKRVVHYSERLGIDRSRLQSLNFVAGHMFIARAKALAPLLNLSIDEYCFEPERGQVDGTMAHAIERLVSVSAESASLRIRARSSSCSRATLDYPYAQSGWTALSPR